MYLAYLYCIYYFTIYYSTIKPRLLLSPGYLSIWYDMSLYPVSQDVKEKKEREGREGEERENI